MYDGIFGKWSVEEDDIREVWLYRYGLSGAAISKFGAGCFSFVVARWLTWSHSNRQR